MLSQILSSLSSTATSAAISVNSSSITISILLKVLTMGKICVKNEDDLDGVEKAAYDLGINMPNLRMERTSRIKKTPVTAVTAKMTFKPQLDETPLNMDTFSARDGGLSQWSNTDAVKGNKEEPREPREDKETTVENIVKSEEIATEPPASSTILTDTHKLENIQTNQVFPCKHCPKKFAGEEYLNIHNESKHSKLRKEDVKTKAVKVINSLSTSSGGTIKLKCDDCDKTFFSQNSLKLHTNTHTKPFQCIKCDKRFSQSGNMRTHTGKCNETQNSISQTGESSELDHCEFCKEEFEDPGELETHMVLMHSISEMIQSSELDK